MCYVRIFHRKQKQLVFQEVILTNSAACESQSNFIIRHTKLLILFINQKIQGFVECPLLETFF